MYCAYCQHAETKVIDSRLADEGLQVRRRRECLKCRERFTTYENVELNLPRIIKRDNSHTAFDQNKLRLSFLKALEKRPVSVEQIDGQIRAIFRKLRASSEREISSQYLGELVMSALKQLDKVAYVRFASVYRSFEDLSEFGEEIKRLEQNEQQTT